VLVYSIFPKTESTLFSSRNNGFWRSKSIPRERMRGESSRKGQPGLNSREATEFRYPLLEIENGAEEEDQGFEL
jgi:hypothetical protein